ncbi:myeloid differentiation primary response protein MyD88 [Brevipalpus obovatus]|uniref:myeloid differentiation primary response protein MyD88 n=1 Tax=Brevipalpus obovatus TaxID=246614 RepID=UPI003D9F941E
MDTSLDHKNISNKEVDFSVIPLRGLRAKSRQKLSDCLNPPMLIKWRGSPRDFRGLVDQFGMDNSFSRIVESNPDPTKAILERIETEVVKSDNQNPRPFTFQDLIDNLSAIQRFDVVDDIMEMLNEDAIRFQQNMESLALLGPGRDRLTIHDDDRNTHYDAYVCYADEDVESVFHIAQFLEAQGFSLFIRDRDLLLGTMEYAAYAELIEKRCNFVIVMLTPEFLKSEECQYQALFAAGLAFSVIQRRIIPLVLKSCDLPGFLRMLTKIDFSRNGSNDWNWRRLILSISSGRQKGPRTSIMAPPIIPISSDSESNRLSSIEPRLAQVTQKGQQLQSIDQAVPNSQVHVNRELVAKKSMSSSQLNESIPSLPSIPSVDPMLKLDSQEIRDISFDSGHPETISLNSSHSAVNLTNGKDKRKRGILQSRFFKFKQKVSPFSSSEPSYGYNCLNECDK